MSSVFDESDFVDSDFQAAQKSGAYAGVATAAPAAAMPVRSAAREELDLKVSDTHQRLAELKRAQETLERERTALEEARRRQSEFENGRAEMLQELTRGLGLLEKAEFEARRDAEQMGRTITGLRDALTKVQAIKEESWSQESWSVELTRALTSIDNARMEWNSARLKWPLLAPAPAPEDGDSKAAAAAAPVLAGISFGQLCRLGFALTWPVVLAVLALIAVLLLR
jgi:hypothetical protein